MLFPHLTGTTGAFLVNLLSLALALPLLLPPQALKELPAPRRWRECWKY